jgi:hypothetical protein
VLLRCSHEVCLRGTERESVLKNVLHWCPRLPKRTWVYFLLCLSAFASARSAVAQAATAHPTPDLCARLQSAVDALPAVGGTVDLRSETGRQACGATVRISGKPVTVFLGPVTWTSTVLPLIQVTGYDKATKFNLVCDHPLASTLLAAADAKGHAALLQFGDPSGDGQRTNTSWGGWKAAVSMAAGWRTRSR